MRAILLSGSRSHLPAASSVMLPFHHLHLNLTTTNVSATVLRMAGDLVTIVITILQLGQFIPQHIECYRDKSVVGLSCWLLFFGGLYTYLAAIDLAITDLGPILRCNKAAWRCFINWQPMVQMAGSAILSGTLWWWYLLYHRNINPDDDEVKLKRTAFYGTDGLAFLMAFILICGVVAAAAGGLVLTYGAKSWLTVRFAHWCGIASAVLNALMWIPQIVTTYTYKHRGALSEYWVLFSIVMDVVYTMYLVFLGLDTSIWLNNVPDGIQTSILLFMIMYYERRDRESGLDDFGHVRKDGSVITDETKALLDQNGDHHTAFSSTL